MNLARLKKNTAKKTTDFWKSYKISEVEERGLFWKKGASRIPNLLHSLGPQAMVNVMMKAAEP
jgi:hypothetical protein